MTPRSIGILTAARLLPWLGLVCALPACVQAPAALGATASEQRYRVFVDGKIGFIDRAGRMAIAPAFESARPFSEGFAAVRREDYRWEFIDIEGRTLSDLHAFELRPFFEGLAATSALNGEVGIRYIDRNGRTVLSETEELRLTAMDGFSGGYTSCTTWKSGRERSCVVDRNGKLAFEDRGYTVVAGFSEGLAKVSRRVGNRSEYGFIDSTGTLVIAWQQGTLAALISAHGWKHTYDTTADTPTHFREGRAPVWNVAKGRHVVIDRQGNEVFTTPLDIRLGPEFSEGLIPYYSANGEARYGFLDRDGKVALPAIWRRVGNFSEGLASVTLDKCESPAPCAVYIDKSGSPRFGRRFRTAENFRNGLAAVAWDEGAIVMRGYIDTKGRMVWSLADPNTDPLRAE